MQFSEFEVNSNHFPGQTHKWRLAAWLQLGYARSNEYFFQNLSTALKLIIVTAKNRIASNKFSMLEGARSIYRGTVRLVDMLIGLPAMRVLPYDTELADEERKFLIAELRVDVRFEINFNLFHLITFFFYLKLKKPSEEEKYKVYCETMREKLKKNVNT